MSKSTNLFSSNHGFKCFWTIEDFTRCIASTGLILRSSKFKVNMLFKSEWFAEILISREGFTVFLCKSRGVIENNVNYSVHLLTSNGWEIKSKGFDQFIKNDIGYGVKFQFNIIFKKSLTICFHLWSGATRFRNEQCVMTSEMIDERQILHFPFQKLPAIRPEDLIFPAFNNSVQAPKVSIDFEKLLNLFRTPKVVTSNKSIQTKATENSNVFNELEDLHSSFKEMKFSYVFLRTETKEFAAHKALLCVQSPVFRAMFDVSKEENVSNIVDVEKIDDETLLLLLQFLHSEPLPPLQWHSAAKLFRAANKYEIEQLKSECLSILKMELSEENICNAYVFADMHHDNELMQIFLEYFCENPRNILSSSAWESFILTETEIASEILCKMIDELEVCKKGTFWLAGCKRKSCLAI